ARNRLEQALGGFESVPELSKLQSALSSLYLGRTLWLLGFPDQALKRTREAEIVGQLSTDPQAKAGGVTLTLDVLAWCGNFDAVREHAQTILDAPWATELGPALLERANIFRGWLMAREGQPRGIVLIRDAMAKLSILDRLGSMYGFL